VNDQDLAQVKADVQSAYYAANQDVALLVADAIVKKWQPIYPTAMASFLDDFEACVAYLRCPPTHAKYIGRPTSPSDRSRRAAADEDNSAFLRREKRPEAVLRRVDPRDERWQRITISDFDRTRLAAVREQLHQNIWRGKARRRSA